MIPVSDNLHLPPTHTPTFLHRGLPPTSPQTRRHTARLRGSTTTAAGGEIKPSVTCNPTPAFHTQHYGHIAASHPTAACRTRIYSKRWEPQTVRLLRYSSHSTTQRSEIWAPTGGFISHSKQQPRHRGAKIKWIIVPVSQQLAPPTPSFSTSPRMSRR